MALTMGGLSTGLDTNSIIDSLMQVQRQPIDRLEAQKTEQNERLEAFKSFDGKLDTLLTKVDKLEASRDLVSRSAELSSDSYASASAASSAVPGTYEIKVGQIAQVEKSVFQGVADKDTTTFGTGTLTLNNDALGAAVSVTIDGTNNTLEGIRDAINAQNADHGVSASIVNDGSGSPYRLVLTGDSVAESNIALDASGLSGGAALPAVDPAVSRSAQQAVIQVDGITITSNTNTLSEAIPGVTLELTHADAGFDPLAPDWDSVTASTLTVDTDSDAVQAKVEEFVSAFNDVIKAAEDENIAGDSGIRAIMRNLRSKLIDSSGGSGMFQLGVSTAKDGTLSIDSSKLTEMIGSDIAAVESLLAGDGVTEGVADKVKSSLQSFTNVTTGFLAGRQKSIDNSVRRIDKEIERGEDRLSQIEQRLVEKFAALETLVGSLNAQSSYLTQQMAALSGGNS